MSDSKATSPRTYDGVIEHVFMLAERRADQAIAAQKPDRLPKHEQRAFDEPLVALALDELDRRAVRARILPPMLFSDTGWLILLDLFVSEHKGIGVPLSESACRWNVGQETALRQIAALIAYGLVERVSCVEADEPVIFSLTANGREALRNALKLEE